MDRHSPPPSNRPDVRQCHRELGPSLSRTGTCDRAKTGWILRSATALVAIICLVTWWEQGSTPSSDNVVDTRPDKIMALASPPDGRWVASAGYQGSVTIWDMTRRRIEAVLEGNRGHVFDLSCSPDGLFLAVAPVDTAVTIWDTKSWNLHRVLQADSRFSGRLTYSPDGTLLATALRFCHRTLGHGNLAHL